MVKISYKLGNHLTYMVKIIFIFSLKEGEEK